jgi:hypothetical protein
MRLEAERHQRLEQPALRVVLGTEAPLLDHHLALVGEAFAHVQVREPLGSSAITSGRCSVVIP